MIDYRDPLVAEHRIGYYASGIKLVATLPIRAVLATYLWNAGLSLMVGILSFFILQLA